MNKPLIYLDQNVIGLQADGSIDLSSVNNVTWVYSKEHFAEIDRGKYQNKFIDALVHLNAVMLDLDLNEKWRITDRAHISHDKSVYECYRDYQSAVADVDFNEAVFDPFMAWINGGGNDSLFLETPENIADEVRSVLGGIGFPEAFADKVINGSTQAIADLLKEMVGNGSDIEIMRSQLGIGKGKAGVISDGNVITKIWNMIGAQCGELTSDQFFGFEPTDKQGYEKWPTYLGIISCCGVLDIVGYQAEKKCRKIAKMPNIRSDAVHIGMGAFCSAIISEDSRLCERAKAIYQYKEIGARVIKLSRK